MKEILTVFVLFCCLFRKKSGICPYKLCPRLEGKGTHSTQTQWMHLKKTVHIHITFLHCTRMSVHKSVKLKLLQFQCSEKYVVFFPFLDIPLNTTFAIPPVLHKKIQLRLLIFSFFSGF